MNVVRDAALAALSALLLATPPATIAQEAGAYPTRPVKIVVPFPPGGATDIMTRNLAQQLSDAWKQPVIVENRAGAGGIIGADAVAKAAADGYTLLTATIAHAANVSLVPNAPYQLQRDLQPVAILGLLPLAVVVPAASPVRSLQDLIEASKRSQLNAGSSGNGTASHLSLELFKGTTGARLQHVPYKGGAPAMTDLIGGQIDVIFALMPEAAPHIKSGRVRALAVTTAERHPLLPDVPTTTEAGVPQLQVSSWNGLMAPAGTSRELVSRINADVKRVIQEAEMKRRIVEAGFQPVSMNVAESDAFVKADVERWRKVVRESNIKAD